MIDADGLRRHDAGAENVAAALRGQGDLLDHVVVHVFVGSDFDRFVLPVVVHDRGIFRHALFGDEDVEECAEDITLLLAQQAIEHRARLLRKRRPIQQHHEFRAALVDVLVLQVLRVRQHEALLEQGRGVGEKVVLRPADHRTPAAARDVGEPDVIAERVAAEEERHAERRARRQVGRRHLAEVGQVDRVEPEREGLLLFHEEISLQRVLDEGQAAVKHGPANCIEMRVAGVVVRHGLDDRRPQRRVGRLAAFNRRLEAQPEQGDELCQQWRVGVDRALHFLPVVTIGLRVRQLRMAKRDERAGERGIVAAHLSGGHKLAIFRGTGGQNLRVEQFALQPVAENSRGLLNLAFALAHRHRKQRIRLRAGRDVEHVGAADAHVTPMQHLHHLRDVAGVGRIGDGKQQARLVRPVGGRREVEVEAVLRLAEVQHPERLDHPGARRHAQVVGVIEPENGEQPIELGQVEDRVRREHRSRRILHGVGNRDARREARLDLGVALAFEREPLDFKRLLHAGHVR